MTSGVLCNEGQNILLPRPGFCLYNTVAGSRNIETRLYNLQADKNWEVDLAHMESLIDDKTACVLINNPSNPCGSNFTKAHLNAILAVCERHQIPLISDEIYADMVFGDQVFTPTGLADHDSLAKQWLVPGWRMGWIMIHDRNNALADVRRGLFALSTLINGPCGIVQAAIPKILTQVPADYLPELNAQLEQHARILESELNKVDGIEVISPQGAMYVMFEGIANDADFCHQLKWEENVELLPGECFNYPGTVRLVITPPKDILKAATERIAAFCARHRK
ncbi:Tyrosine/nicotianamine aminotransferase [Linderina pennispora]|uniref:Tyrosine/nicotianamine aminotransferase n=1 Tax=Linderina pennispora TaxID=61395 RepID=A0A1Y1WMT7_9FUNG|nr:Tyrosine/nicotianamine aminotransferase [Linderina pennispora]ORX74675.1 Tyrosine/nicotianamine aminotransferase [Linderina pennispora]